MKILKVLKIVGIVIGSLFLLFVFLMTQPFVFIPHKHIVISLPFAPSDDATTGLIPMGEKIEHNASNGNPDGHGGIDFGFSKVTGIIAAADGNINSVKKNSEGSYDVEEGCGLYKITYKEMNSVEKNIKWGTKVKQGDLLGYSGRTKQINERPKPGDPSGQIHWEFSSASMIIDRLCPVNYFDASAKARIEKIWDNVPSNDRFKSEYPKICNGVFDGKED